MNPIALDAVYLKQETLDLALHVFIEINSNGGLKQIKPAHNSLNEILISSKLDTECPSCQCLLAINIIVHDAPVETGNVQATMKLIDEVIVKEEEEEKTKEINHNNLGSDNDDSDNVSESPESVSKDHDLNDTRQSKSGHKKQSNPPQKNIPIKTDPKNRVLFCMYCFETCESREHQREHIKNHEVCCRRCDPPLFFSCLKRLRYHYRNHHFESHPLYSETKECPQCSGRYRLTKFEAHVQQCFPLTCEFCNKSFKCKNTLRKHRRYTHLGGYNHEFTCDVCGKVYTRKQDFDHHYVIHQSDPRPFKCHFCPTLGFRTKSQARKHIEITHLHRPDPIAKCTECGLVMKQRYFRQHMFQIHVQGRIFKCNHCLKGFPTKWALTKHEKIHTDDRPFPCPHCDQRFRQKAGLVSHIRLHTGEKPYECGVCHIKYADRGCYRSHLLKHEKELGITLDKSVKKFNTKSQQ